MAYRLERPADAGLPLQLDLHHLLLLAGQLHLVLDALLLLDLLQWMKGPQSVQHHAEPRDSLSLGSSILISLLS